MNPIHILTPYFLPVHFNIIIPCTPWSSKWSFPYVELIFFSHGREKMKNFKNMDEVWSPETSKHSNQTQSSSIGWTARDLYCCKSVLKWTYNEEGVDVALTLRRRIWKALGLNLCPDAGCPNSGYSCFFLGAEISTEILSQFRHYRFLPDPFQFLIHPTIRRDIVQTLRARQRSRDSSVGIATGYTAVVRFTAGARHFSVLKTSGYRGLFTWG
jgi:hypothetical protein